MKQIIITVPYMVGIGSDGNIMPLYIYKKLFPRAMKGQLAATRNTKIKLTMYNNTQLGICRVKVEQCAKCAISL